MLWIKCPHCGERPETEFVYGGDATVKRPDPDTASNAEWAAYIYERDNPKGPHRELWLHASGCHAWLEVERDVVTHALGAVRYADGREP